MCLPEIASHTHSLSQTGTLLDLLSKKTSFSSWPLRDTPVATFVCPFLIVCFLASFAPSHTCPNLVLICSQGLSLLLLASPVVWPLQFSFCYTFLLFPLFLASLSPCLKLSWGHCGGSFSFFLALPFCLFRALLFFPLPLIYLMHMIYCSFSQEPVHNTVTLHIITATASINFHGNSALKLQGRRKGMVRR